MGETKNRIIDMEQTGYKYTGNAFPAWGYSVLFFSLLMYAGF